MANIFESAKHVLACIGRDENDSEYAMEMMENYNDYRIKPQQSMTPKNETPRSYLDILNSLLIWISTASSRH